jgi:hypothetical protein
MSKVFYMYSASESRSRSDARAIYNKIHPRAIDPVSGRERGGTNPQKCNHGILVVWTRSSLGRRHNTVYELEIGKPLLGDLCNTDQTPSELQVAV